MSIDSRTLLLDILNVLQKYSDEDNGLNQKSIIDILEREYGYENLYPKRRTVKNNIDKLLEYSDRDDRNAIEIEYKSNDRYLMDKKTGKEKVNYEHSNFRYIHDFTYGELRLMIDSILFSKHIPSGQKQEMIEKLEKLSSIHFNSRMKYIQSLSTVEPINYQLFINIEEIEEAIRAGKQIMFTYNQYTVDEQNKLVLQPRTNKDGTVKEYTINPYQMVATNGRYYLICNNDAYDNLSNYRVDRIANIKVLKTQRKPLRKLADMDGRLDLAKYMAERIYMYQGKASSVKLRLKKVIITDFIDWFGSKQIDFSEQTEEEITARVTVNEEAMRKWALQYGLYVRVLSPPKLVEQVKKDIQQVVEKYE